jgi:hypothetical protein
MASRGSISGPQTQPRRSRPTLVPTPVDRRIRFVTNHHYTCRRDSFLALGRPTTPIVATVSKQGPIREVTVPSSSSFQKESAWRPDVRLLPRRQRTSFAHPPSVCRMRRGWRCDSIQGAGGSARTLSRPPRNLELGPCSEDQPTAGDRATPAYRGLACRRRPRERRI